MTSLREIMETFQASILEQSTAIEPMINGADTEFKQERMAVYQHAYYLRLQEVLAKSFPAVKQLAGEEPFAELTYQYLVEYPSRHFSVRYVGQYFSQFLAEQDGMNPLWVEMATFEWILEYVSDAQDAPQLTFEEMAGLHPDSWSELILHPHPSLQTAAFFYPIPSLWQALLQQQQRPALEAQQQPTHWLVWRFKRQAYFRAMNVEQLWMMRAIQSGQTFAQVCTGLCDWLAEDKVVPFAAETLRTWVSEGIFATYTIADVV